MGNPNDAATLAELEISFPDVAPTLLAQCATRRLTIAQARNHIVSAQAAQIAAHDKQLELGHKPAFRKPGVPAVSSAAAECSGAAAGGDALADFDSAVQKQMTKPGFADRKKAIAAVCRANPQLHQSYLEATNTGLKQRELIGQRFEG